MSKQVTFPAFLHVASKREIPIGMARVGGAPAEGLTCPILNLDPGPNPNRVLAQLIEPRLLLIESFQIRVLGSGVC